MEGNGAAGTRGASRCRAQHAQENAQHFRGSQIESGPIVPPRWTYALVGFEAG